MKKIFTCLLVLMLALGLFACKRKNPTPTPEEISEELKNAKNYLFAMYKNDAAATPSDYDRVAQVTVGGVTYTITWTVQVTTGNADQVKIVTGNGVVTIDVDEKAESELAYTLTATIKDANGKEVSLSWDHTVPAFKELTYPEYEAKEAGDPVVVKGVITATSSKSRGNSYNCIYFEDATGGYYAYGMQDDPDTLGLEVGMTIRVTGAKDIYSGTHEIKNATVEVVSETKTPVTPADYTALAMAAADNKDANLLDIQAKLVTINGVELTEIVTANGYYKFKIGNLNSYLRISSSVCPLSKEDQATMIANFKTGYTANVTGVICVYDGAFYLTPVDANAIELVGLPDLSDADAVAFEKENMKLFAQILEAGDYELPAKGTAYEKVAVAWATESTLVTIEDGKLKVAEMPASTEEITLTATLTAGDASDTLEFKVKLVASKSFISVALKDGAALENKAYSTDMYMIIGFVEEVTTAYSDQYKNVSFTVTDGAQSILVYRYNLEDAADIKAGDFVSFAALLQNYNGTIEACSKFEAMNVLSAAKAAEVAAGDDAEAKKGVLLYGQVKEINTVYSEQYDNITFTITDGKDDFYCYRVKGGADLAVGDYVLITGTLTVYNNVNETAAGATYVTSAIYVPTEEPQPLVLEHAGTAEDPYTVADALALAGSYSVGQYSDEQVYVKGVIVEAKQGSYLSNVYIVDAGKENKFLVYSVNFTEAVAEAYPNDEVVIKGFIANYNGTLEMTSKKVDNVTVYNELVSKTAGNGTVTATGDHATVTFSAESGVNGTEFTFTVAAENGYKVDAVKVNGTAVEAVEGTYTAKFQGPTAVVVETSEADAVVYKAKLEYTDTTTTTNMKGEGNQAASVNLDETKFTVTADKGTNNNFPGLNKAGEIRVYNGNSFVVALADGYYMTSITINFNAGAENCIIEVNGAEVTGENGVYEINAAAFTLKHNCANNTQVKFASIEITYTEGSAPAPEFEFTEEQYALLLEKLATEFVADYNTHGEVNLSSAAEIDTDSFSSSSLDKFLAKEEMVEKWGWLFEALNNLTEDKAHDIYDATFDVTAHRPFFIANLNGFLTRSLHKDTWYEYESMDFTDDTYFKPVMDRFLYGELAKELGAEFVADFNAKLGAELEDASQIDTLYMDSDQILTFFADEEMGAKWAWLKAGLAKLAGNNNPEKSFLIPNLNGLFTLDTHTDTWLETESLDYTDLANVKAVIGEYLALKYAGPVEPEKEVVTATDVLYVNPAWAESAAEDKVEIDEKLYVIGTNAFGTVDAALEAATEGATVYLMAGTYANAITISKSVTLVGPNAEANPNKDQRAAEAVITAKLTYKADNITVAGLEFTAGASVVCLDVKNPVFKNNYVHDITEVEYTWAASRNYDAPSFFNASKQGNTLEGLEVLNNKFDKVANINVFASVVKNLKMEGNTFTNFKYDAVRFDGGYDGGKWYITNNTFANDELGGYNGVYFRTTGDAQDKDVQEIYVTGNTFKNIDSKSATYSGALSINGYQEYGVKIEICNNKFENCTNYLFTRNNATAANHAAYPWNCVIAENEFKGVPTTYYVKNLATSGDNDQTAPAKIVYYGNAYYDAEGKAVAEDATKIIGKDTTSYKAYLGHKGYATLALALEDAQEGDTIYLEAGTYADDLALNKGVKLYGPNFYFTGSERNAEAEFTGKITLAAGLKGVELVGFKFSGNAQIVNTLGEAGAADNLKTNLDGFKFANNLVNTTLTGKGFIYFVEAASCYSHDIVFHNNKFDGTGSTLDAIVYLDNLYNLELKGNTFANASAMAFYVNDKTKGLSGETTLITENTFKSIGSDAIKFNWMSYLPASPETATAKVEVNANTFEDVTGIAIFFGKCNNGDTKYAKVSANDNIFKGTLGTGVHFQRVVSDDVFFATGNTFESVPTSYYIVNEMAASENKTVVATGNTFGTTPTADKFSGSVRYE